MNSTLKIAVHTMSASACALNAVCDDPGINFEATQFVCKALHLNCMFSWYNDTEFGDADADGIGSGLVGAIQRGEFDTSLPTFTPTHSRMKAITFSNVYFYGPVVLVTRNPRAQSNFLNWIIVRSFQWPVWVCFLVALFMTVGMSPFVLQHLLRSDRSIARNRLAMLDVLIKICLSLITRYFSKYLLRSNSIRVLFTTWVTANVILSSCYTGYMFSQKVLNPIPLPYVDLETFIDCLERDACSLVDSSMSSSYLQYFLSPDTEYSSRLRSIFDRNPVRVMPREARRQYTLREKNRFVVSIMSWSEFVIGFSKKQYCKFYVLELPYFDFRAFPVAKNSTFKETLSRMAMIFREHGVNEMIERKYLKKFSCDQKHGQHAGKSPLWFDEGKMLYSMLTTFGFLIFGMSIGLLAFFIELRWKGL